MLICLYAYMLICLYAHMLICLHEMGAEQGLELCGIIGLACGREVLHPYLEGLLHHTFQVPSGYLPCTFRVPSG